MKRILVPVDFSKEAESAARVAASIAKKTGSEIFLVHMLGITCDYYRSCGNEYHE